MTQDEKGPTKPGVFGMFGKDMADVAAVAEVMAIVAQVRRTPPKTVDDVHVFLIKLTDAVVNRGKVGQCLVDANFGKILDVMKGHESVMSLILFLLSVHPDGPAVATPAPSDGATALIEDRRFAAALDRVAAEEYLRDRLRSELVKTVETWSANMDNTTFQGIVGNPAMIVRILEILPTLNQLVGVLGQ